MTDLVALNAAVQAAKPAKATAWQNAVSAWVAEATSELAPAPPPRAYPFWAASSFLFVPIDWSKAQVGGDSVKQIAKLAAASPAGIWPNGQQYDGAGAPTIYDAAQATTTAKLTQSRDGTTTTIPWNPVWVSGPTGDKQIAVVDYVTGIATSVNLFDKSNPSALKCQAWCVYNITTMDGTALPGSVGIGPLLSGIDLPSEYAAGVINHRARLAIQTASSAFVKPYALRSDGNTAPDGIPSGSHLALPPDVSLAGLDQYQTISAVRYQVYGGTVFDSGGGTSQSMQSTASGITYPAQINPLPQTLLAKFVVLA